MVCHAHPFMDTRNSIRNLFIVIDCGFRAHKKCSEKLPNDCMPNMKKLKRMFGLDLTTLLKATNKSIPYVVEKCVEEIERRGKLTYKHEYYKLNTLLIWCFILVLPKSSVALRPFLILVMSTMLVY